MSAIVGIYRLDEGGAEAPVLEGMLETMAHRGRDASGAWLNGQVGLGHRMLWTTLESLEEKLPAVSAAKDLVVTADARIDNRDELRSWTWKSLELVDAFLTDEQLRDDLEASACLAEHLSGVVEWKRNHLADDVLSVIIRAADEGEIMRPEQIVPYVHTP